MKYNTRDANGESVIEEQEPPPPAAVVRKAGSGSRSDNQLPFRLRMALKSLSQPFMPLSVGLPILLFVFSSK